MNKEKNHPNQKLSGSNSTDVTPIQATNPAAETNQFRRFANDIVGVLTIAFALMTIIALLELTEGTLLSWWARIIRNLFGFGSWIVVITIGVVGLSILLRKFSDTQRIKWSRILALEISAFSLLAILSIYGGHSLERVEQGLDGGLVGWGLVELFGAVLSPTWLLLLVFGFLCLVFGMLGLGLETTFKKLADRLAASTSEQVALEQDRLISEQGVIPEKNQDFIKERTDKQKRKLPRLPSEFRKKFKIHLPDEKSSKAPERDERLPPLELLVSEHATRTDERTINMTAGLIEKTLAEFGIPAKVVGFQIGPTVTQFAVEPGFVEKPGTEEAIARHKVRVSQISALSRDLSLALAAERLRIEAPVPGRPYVGIEVPNPKTTVVRLRPILENESFYRFGSPLTIALGRDVSGQAVVADLASMPHLLIAGTTGSGKSVAIASLTTCLAMNNTPEDLRLVMIDPKMVELVRFNGLPHLFGKVETNLERILGVLRWTVTEMDHRYKILEASRSRNIDTYNRKIRRRKGESPLPHIVVMIDELADLMMSAPEQTEHTLVRLAQMARATGIHLIVATQRPSTDVVTGVIKANFPARISFAVASSVDSRVILDSIGAESLLGRGDMLFLHPEASSPVRVQGVMVTDNEVEKVITFWQKAGIDEQEEIPPWEEIIEQDAAIAEKDNLVPKAIDIVRQTQRASASLLQRRLRIGYPRAARLIDELEELGIIGPSHGSGREREVLVDPDDEIET
ncbi:MAG: DNA translocase FtsK [Anaerolineales bacterium]|nr:DNA translocase FtsK [Anaerolineales bacterium]